MDFKFENHGSLYLVRAMNDEALAHLKENVDDEAQWLGNALAVEPRYVCGLADALREAGFRVEGR